MGLTSLVKEATGHEDYWYTIASEDHNKLRLDTWSLINLWSWHILVSIYPALPSGDPWLDESPDRLWMSVYHCLGYIFPSQGSILFFLLAATKQLYKWYFPSVRPSVCLSVRPSVRHTFLTMFPSSNHHEFFRSYYQWQKWRPCKRSRSEVKGQGHRGHNPTLPFPDCNSSLNSHMMMKWCI